MISYRFFKNGKVNMYYDSPSGRRTTLGMMILEDVDKGAAWVNSFSIIPRARNKGHGTTFIKAVVSYAKLKGCGAISLYCYEDNYKAERFYKRNGFFIAGYTQPHNGYAKCILFTQQL